MSCPPRKWSRSSWKNAIPTEIETGQDSISRINASGDLTCRIHAYLSDEELAEKSIDEHPQE